ncbi:DUF1206 domain-containing protein [Streptomyces sp. NPDC020707]|uniref:DUF1206 domain-containing protein n=1 Tax=Streptomyces ortus TaxID=2867268 RepID=A0ABT3VE24_9ACTN|nr:MULTISPECIES: DUF1206 domain-containing protein [Streptomyces]MCX4238182.1 DUF1206 domain-containing protein [Streptomyces ortus]
MNASTLTRGGRAGKQKAAPAIEGAARAGFTARGVIYLLVGLLALQIAFGDSGKQADQGGALEEVASKPFGEVVLWALGVGVVGMALWRLSEAIFGAAGPDGNKPKKRLASAGRAVFYGFVAYSVISFAAGAGGSGSSDGKSRDATAKAMDLPAGRWLVGIAGVVILCAGLWMVVQAARRKYHKHMRLTDMSRKVRQGVDVTGVGGGVARGLVFAVAGGFAVRAAWDYEPDKAKGMDDTLRSFAETPVGPWLLVLIAVGLMLFGLFSFAMARYRKV